MARRTLTLPPPCVAVREQLHDSDCGVAAISMALGIPYREVLRHAPYAVIDGISLRRFHQIGAALGVKFSLVKDANLEDDTGLLWVDFSRSAHLVYIHHGLLINPSDATVWSDPYDYLRHHGGEGHLYRISPCVQHGPKQGRRET